MFRFTVLGLLRDGTCRHGYELMREHRARTCSLVSTGNFYRELGKLAACGLIDAGKSDPGTDSRRIPYQITTAGVREFDMWLTAPGDQKDLSARLLFIDLLSPDAVCCLLDRWEQELLVRKRSLEWVRERASRAVATVPELQRFDLLPALVRRRTKLIAADLDSVRELRRDFVAWRKSIGRFVVKGPEVRRDDHLGAVPRDASDARLSGRMTSRRSGRRRGGPYL